MEHLKEGEEGKHDRQKSCRGIRNGYSAEMQLAGVRSRFRRVAGSTVLTFLVLVGSGCISQKPLPYAAIQKNLAPSGPALTILPVEDRRGAQGDLSAEERSSTLGDLDKVAKIPECVEEVLATEMEGLGMFQSVSRRSASSGSDYTLAVGLDRLEWEVPNHDRMVGTAMGISLLTGGIGGLIYGSTDAEVLGHATLTMQLRSGEMVILDKNYSGTAKETKAKMNSDTPGTGREMAAKALAVVMGQLKTDLLTIQQGKMLKLTGK